MTKSIVLEVCRECEVDPADFFGASRNPKVMGARRIAIEKLHEAGFGYRVIARLVRRDYSTVQYWMSPKNRSYRLNWRQRKQHESRA